jgi:phosphate transport system substrate-binding protein
MYDVSRTMADGSSFYLATMSVEHSGGRMRFRVGLLALSVAGVMVGGAHPGHAQQQITGAGATFPAPVYAAWGEAAKSAIGIELNYQPIGSGGGQNQILNRTVDFGASDAPMAPEKLQSGNLLQFPSVMGAVVPIVNIPGIEPNKMKLTGEMLADIYLGKITKWNDPKLVEMNRDLKLPSLAIAPVYRADGSGTTFVYTSYLSAVSPEWKSKVGASTSVRWVAGNGAKGNDGVAATVKQVRGGIGYVEYAYAAHNHLTTTQLRNKAGAFVEPTIDTPGAKSWPIVSATFIELPKNPKDPARSAGVMKFFDWAYANGDGIAAKLDYVPLPQAVKDSVRGAWRSEIKGPDGQPIYK